tara:strand:+ start:4439 stop:4957 length:519 start_codon:yes stop_codon:yes gene_type:complete
MSKIELINGDITNANVDAIVNAANTRMLGGGGVDGAIHRAAGPELLRACYAVKESNGVRCPFGEARITAAGNLNAQFVIHAVGPIYDRFANPSEVLRSTYQCALNLAVEHRCENVALPAISCGVYGYPPKEAAQIALTVCKQEEYRHMTLSFYLFGEEMLSIWQKELEALGE